MLHYHQAKQGNRYSGMIQQLKIDSVLAIQSIRYGFADLCFFDLFL
jgi:hypothetical protein